MNIVGKVVLVIGTGVSGIGAATLLKKVGAVPVIFDSNDKVSVESIREKLAEDKDITIVLKEVPKELFCQIDLLVVSPGVPIDSELVLQFKSAKIPVWGEIELAYRFAKGKLLAITGTNGKTTTTALLGRIMKDYCESVFIVGNIGTPYTLESLETKEDSVTVAEISSFQLETAPSFHPHISAILNITPDHLNRHYTMENYASVKEAIAMNQTKEDTCVLNYEDEYTRNFGERCQAKVFYFSSKRKLKKGIYLENENIYVTDGYHTNLLLNIHSMKLLGIHNVENVMAAAAMAISFGVPVSAIVKSILEFPAVEHRIEYVTTKKGVDYYNDSKGTNPEAAIKGIQAMKKKTVLIGGGYDKNSTYDDWIEAFSDKVKCLILLGQTKEKIAACARKHGFEEILFVESLEEAVAESEKRACVGEAVLLSPACASWGMFPNYEVRGEVFKKLVQQIKE